MHVAVSQRGAVREYTVSGTHTGGWVHTYGIYREAYTGKEVGRHIPGRRSNRETGGREGKPLRRGL